MSIWAEKFYPLIGAIFASFGTFFFMPGFLIEHIIQNLMNPALTISAIAIGFLATTKTLLATIEDKDIIKKLKDVGYYIILLEYIMAAVKASFITAILSAIGIVVADFENLPWLKYGLALWVGSATYTGLSFYRVIQIISSILKSE